MPVKLNGPKGSVRIMAFIDEGSKISLLEDEVARHLGLTGVSSNLCLGWIGGRTTNESSRKVNMEICGIGNHGNCFDLRNVWTTENLHLPPQTLHLENFKNKFPILEQLKVENYVAATPKLLIGLPHIRLVRPFNVINLDDSFAVHQTNLGNILFGSNENSTKATVCRIGVEYTDDLHQQIAEYFTVENFGVMNTKLLVSHEDEKAEEILQQTTRKSGRQYETGLLWRQDKFDYVDTYTTALKRLNTLEIKLKKDESLFHWYTTKMEDYITKSYARKLAPEEIPTNDHRIWYLPHFVITNINKGNKRRLVFDAAATIGNESFNSRLMKGPSKYQPKSLIGILFKFRQKKIGVCADIREMFHRVKIRDEDQVAQRFLWRECDSTKPPDVYVMQVMIFGSACSPCSSQYVKNINAAQYEDIHPRAVRAITECHYVDDYIDSFDSVEEAIAVSKDVVNIHKEANFELRGFVSNAIELCEVMNDNKPKVDILYSTNFSNGEISSEKILGMFWQPSQDIFCFILKFNKVPEAVLNGSRKPTKREVLSLTMSIFDPFGFLANHVVASKVILQELWRHKVDWGSQIPDIIYDRWFKWYKELEKIKQIVVPRCYGLFFCDPSAIVDLHIFVDASEVAFSAVAYWRISTTSMVDIAFVIGKTRCAPIKPLSIPRLELQAAVLGVRLCKMIKASHDIEPRDVTFWSDSKTVIKWIQSDSRIYKQFVSHRISEILENSEVNQWRWVPSSQNPADEATRIKSTLTKSCWLNGPNFLKSNLEDWPKMPDDVSHHDCEGEMRSKFICTLHDFTFIPFDKYSSYYKLLRVMSWVFRAIFIFKSLVSDRGNYVTQHQRHLSVEEINRTELFLCKVAQRDSFAEEYTLLQHDKPLPKSSSIYKLTPFLSNDGLIRLTGRIQKAYFISDCTRQPIILPKVHVLTDLIIMQYHKDFKHQNQESICAAIRLKFWIPGLRQLVRSTKAKCQVCKNLSAVPQPPLMGQHPIDRLSPYIRPFSYTGIDYMGPFMVSIGRRNEKRWVAIFTCLTVRAIHLELAKDLSTDAVILCIRNFVNRRGLPVRLRSDRGTNFIGASKEMFAYEDARIADECTRRGIEWLFNTPSNPSAGGAWERMVRSVKKVLSFTLQEKAPQIETLISLLIEAENLVNSRPLTHISIDSSDNEPLTPNHFLLGCPNLVQTPAVPDKVCLKKQWNILQQLKQTFWKRWVLEYLPELTRRTKWHHPVKPIQVGDVVVICDDNEARGQWKQGVVEEVFVAPDGQVRSAVVRTVVGRLKRPASKLAVLDVGGESPRSTHGRRDVAD